MSVTLKHLGKGRVVTVSDEAAAGYLEAGWVGEDEASAPSLSWTKDRLLAHAAEHGIDVGEAKTKAELLAVIAPPAE